ncbi:MAG: hypothetical protein NVSMB3_12620 [Acidobacteriaceae bacterium]
MAMKTRLTGGFLLRLSLTLALASTAVLAPGIVAQAPAAARAVSQRGTVKSIDGANLTLASDSGQQVAVTVAADARIQRLAPGSTDLKTAETAVLSDIAVGDRILVSGAPGDAPENLHAARVILMKSSDIAQKHEAEQVDWKRRGIGGIVSAVDATSGALTVSAGARKLQIATTSSTSFRRYADGSTRFEDAKPGTLAQIRVGDQLLARGAKSQDGSSVQAEEVVSGSFKNLSGTILSVDSGRNSVTLKDIVGKRNVTVQLTPNSAIRRLPPEEAAALASRARGVVSAGALASGSAPAGAAPTRSSSTGASPAAPPAHSPEVSTAPASHLAGAGRSGAPDLSQIVSRLPPVAVTDLHVGDAVMIVAEQSSADASSLTAITLLAGVESILAASPGGSPAMTLSPWSLGGGAPDPGGSQ